MQRSSRVDYDSIADRYDATPHREKSVDPELAAFLAGRASPETLSLLDIACGTGNQLVANRAAREDDRARRLARHATAGAKRRIEQELRDPRAAHTRPDHLCFITIRGDKPARIA